MTSHVLAVSALVLGLSLGAPARAQDPTPVTTVDEIVVTARRAGAPMWTVRQDDRTLILVGEIKEAPRGFEWRAQALEDAAGRADRILFPQEGRASPADFMRLIWRIRTIGFLPEGRTTSDYLDVVDQARLDALMAEEKSDRWRRLSLLMIAIDLMNEKAGGDASRPVGVAAAVRKAARKAGTPIRPIGVVRGDEVVEALIVAPPAGHVPCLRAALAAAEEGADATARRAEAWRGLRVAEVMASPVDQAFDRCWPWGDPEIGPRVRSEWTTALEQALTELGVTMAVVPLRALAEPDGVLDALVAQGYEIEGPEWKAASAGD